MSFRHDQEVVTAALVDASPVQPPANEPKKPRSCFFPCLIIFGICLLLMVGAGYALFRALSPPEQIVQTPEQVEQAIEERNARIRSSLSNRFEPVDKSEFASISRFVGRVAEVADNDLNPDTQALIDFDRYAREMRRNPEIGGLAYLGNSFAAAAIQQRVIGPMPFSDFQIFDIEKISENDRKVLLHTSGAYDDSAPFIWWITKSGKGRWKLYDWEMLEYGIRETREAAILIGDHDVNRALDYETYVDAIADLDDDSGYGGNGTGKSFYESCRKLEFNDDLKDSTYLNIALNLSHSSLHDESIEFLDRISDERRTPGSLRLRASVYVALGRHEDAIKPLEDYIDEIGPCSGVVEELANVHAELGNRNKEVEVRRLGLLFDQAPYSTNISTVFLLEDPNNVGGIFETIDTSEDPEGIYEELISQMGENAFALKHMEKVAQHLESSDSSERLITLAKGEREYLKGNYERSLELLEHESIQSDEDLRYDYWSRAISLGMAEETFATCKDKLDAFETIAFIFEEYDHEFEPEEFFRISKQAIELDPENPRNHHLAGSALYDMDKHEQAIGYFESARKKFATTDSDDYEVEYNNSLLAQSYYKTGKEDQMLKVLDGQTRNTLLHYIKEDGKLSEFTTLINQLEPEDRKYYQALALIESGEMGKARAELLDLVKEAEPNEYGYSNLYRVISALLETCDEDRSAAIAVFNSTMNTEVFTQLSNRFVLDGDWKSANDLATAGRLAIKSNAWNSETSSSYEDPATAHAALNQKLLWYEKKYAELAQTFNQMNSRTLRNELEDPSPIDWQYVYRAALRSNQKDIAQGIVDQVRKQSTTDDYILGLAALHANDLPAIKEIYRTMSYNNDFFLSDPDAPELSKAQRRQIIGVRPRKLNVNPFYGEEELIVLLEKPLEFNEAKAKTLAEQLLPEPATVTAVENDIDRTHPTWLIRSKHHLVSVRLGKKLDTSEVDVPDELKEAFEKHQATIVIGFDTSEWNSDSPRKFALELANTFDFESPIAVALNDYWMPWKAGKQKLKSMRNGKFWPSQFESKASLLYLNADIDEPNEVQSTWYREDNDFMVSFAEAYDEFTRSQSTDKKLVAFVRVRFGSTFESLPIEVKEIQVKPWTQNLLTGVARNENRIDPTLSTGENVRLNASFVYKWQMTIDGKETSNEE